MLSIFILLIYWGKKRNVPLVDLNNLMMHGYELNNFGIGER